MKIGTYSREVNKKQSITKNWKHSPKQDELKNKSFFLRYSGNLKYFKLSISKEFSAGFKGIFLTKKMGINVVKKN